MDSSDYAFQSQRQVECHQAFASWEQEPFSENNDGVPKIFVVSLKGKKNIVALYCFDQDILQLCY